jgi:DNA-binding NtrC family response regulator
MSDETTVLSPGDPPALDSLPIAEQATVILQHGDAVRTIGLRPGDSLTLGRGAPSDLIVHDRSLSRLHLRLSWESDGIHVTDLQSRNGTWLSGERIEHSRVFSGARVVAGSVTLAVQLGSSPEAAQLDIEGHAAIKMRIDEELARARCYHRPFALLALRALPGQRAHVSQFCLRVRTALPRFAPIGMYAPHLLLAALPEANQDDACALAQALLRTLDGVVCGLANLSPSAASVEAIIAQAFEAAHEASAERPLVIASTSEAPRAERGVVIENAKMRALYTLVERVADDDLPVLVLGETGTGKELVARRLHAAGSRAGKPLHVLNCAAIPPTLVESLLFGHERGAFTGADRLRKGVFEEADGGTVFLDEVGELPALAQAALLRTLETRRVTRVGSTREIEVDVRLVAATHQDLAGQVGAGAFRRDLLHRLNALTLELPPLRERRDEIVPLARTFLTECSQRRQRKPLTLTAEAERALLGYEWPGNVRELRNVIARGVAVATGTTLGAAELPSELTRAPASLAEPPSVAPDPEPKLLRDMDYRERLAVFERNLIQRALAQTDGSHQRAAELLGLPRRTLSYKVRALGVRSALSVEPTPDDPSFP